MSATQPNPFAPPRAKVDRPAKSSRLLPHHKAGRAIRAMAWLGVVGWVGIVAAVLLPAMSAGKELQPAGLGIALGMLAFVVGLFFLGSAVKRHRTWARWVGIAYGLLSLLGFPIGTIVGAYILWHLLGGWAEGEDDEA